MCRFFQINAETLHTPSFVISRAWSLLPRSSLIVAFVAGRSSALALSVDVAKYGSL
jgi:hypothetical protein